MIPLVIIPVVIFVVLFLQSDSFWTNLPMTITALGIFISSVVSTIFAIRASNRAKVAVDKTAENKTAIEEVHKTTNSKMDLLLAAKDKEAKAIADAKILDEAKKAAYNEGLLAAISQQAKDDLLRNMPSPIMQPANLPSPPLTEKLIDKSAEKIADKVVEKSADKIGEKVIEVVVEKVVTEKDDTLKKKPD